MDPVKYTTHDNPLLEEMIRFHMEWLNTVPDLLNDATGPITREQYDEWDDPPVLVLDTQPDYTGHLYDQRIIALTVSPFHDEGGCACLIATFNNYSLTAEPEWRLISMMHEFDTYADIVVSSSALVPHAAT